MQKILISFLGTGQPRDGEYRMTNYTLNGQEYHSAFIAQALIQFLQYDKVFLIGTSKSMWENAYEVFVKNHQDKQQEELFNIRTSDTPDGGQLKPLLSQSFGNSLVEAVLIENGIDEGEMQSNLMQLSERLLSLENCTIDLDITHSFRSLPFFVNPSLNFLTASNKTITLGNIWYGMFELAGENKGKAPIVNLKPSQELNELFRATRSFLDFGNAFPLIGFLRESKHANKTTVDKLENLAKAISLGNANDVVTYARKFQEEVSNTPWQDHLSIVQEEILKGFVDILKIKMDDPRHIGLIAVAKWYKNNNMFLHAGIVANEALRAYIIQNNKIVADNPLPKSQSEYENINQKFNQYLKGKNKGIFSLYKNLNKARIRLAHAGVEQPNSTLNDWNNLENYIDQATNIENYKL